MTREPARPARAPGRPSSAEIAILQMLALAGADQRPVLRSSREVAQALGISQQAASRHLIRLERRGWIERTLGDHRQRLLLVPAARAVLENEYWIYRRIFEGPLRLAFRGTVVPGLGEGRYYLEQPGYGRQFTERLGYAPYPGTLNVRAEPGSLRRLPLLHRFAGIRIDGFEANGRTFGGATCYPVRVRGRPAHLVRPDRSHYADVLELIAPVRLRDELRLRDGETLEVEVEEG